MKILSLCICAVAVVPCLALEKHELVADPVTECVQGHENTEWSTSYAFHLTDAKKDLPRVLLIGDSVCNRYVGPVAALLEGKVNVSYWISSRCVTEPGYLKELDLEIGRGRYDVVHFNNGLHTSSKTPLAEYEEALYRALVHIRARQPKARIIWVTSTPLRKDPSGRIAQLNAAGARAAARIPDIETDDLYALMDPVDRATGWADQYHHTASSSKLQAEQIASRVLSAVGQVANPIAGPQAPDPCVVWDADTKYYYHLHSEHWRLELYRAKHLADILTSEHKTLYVTNAADRVYGDIWAPELHKAPNGKWYIYTSGRHLPEKRAEKRLFIMESKTSDPYDGFVFKGMPTPDTFSIDPTVMTWTDGRQYVCYSEVVPGRGQVLVLREMTNPWTFGSRQVEIAHAELPWELKDGHMNEGPFFVFSPQHLKTSRPQYPNTSTPQYPKTSPRLFVVYSGNGCWHDDYALGVVEFTGGDLFDAANWKKHEKQLLVKGNGCFGPGHATFFRSPDGTELWCAYHGLAKSNPSNTPTMRWLNVQRVSFDETGFPVMGEAIGATPQKAPSGEWIRN